MYTPKPFKVESLSEAHSFMQEHAFATIFSQVGTVPEATHLPFLLDGEDGPYGTLVFHMARANPIWKGWQKDTKVLVAFTGPHTYVSPAWYVEQATVPTWNYSAVHVTGTPQQIEDLPLLERMVRRLVTLYEAKEGKEWDQRLMEGVIPPELRAIVGFSLRIDSLEAKFKFNQNRALEDQVGVSVALQKSACPFKRAAGAFMERLQRKS